MSERPTVRRIVAGIAALALIGVAWQATAQQPRGGKEAQPEQGQMMQCPMMSAIKSLELQADSPAVLLAMADKLELTQEQKQRLKNLVADTRAQARKILTDNQQQQLAEAPEGSLSMMQLAMLVRDGRKAEQGQMCPMCMKMMRERMQAKEAQGGAEHAEHHPEGDNGR